MQISPVLTVVTTTVMLIGAHMLRLWGFWGASPLTAIRVPLVCRAAFSNQECDAISHLFVSSQVAEPDMRETDKSMGQRQGHAAVRKA